MRLQDVLINNAGLGYHVHVLDYEESSARNVFDVVYWGTLAMTKAFAPLLMEAGKHPGGGIKGQGVLVNVSSIGGFAWIPTMSKHLSQTYLLKAVVLFGLEPNTTY